MNIKKSRDDVRDAMICLAVTPEEKMAIARAAYKNDMSTSAFIRMAVFDKIAFKRDGYDRSRV